MAHSYAKLFRAVWTIGDRKERNRRTVQREGPRGAVADFCIAIDNSPDKSVTYNPRYWTARWEWRRIEVKRLLDEIIKTGIFKLIKKPGEKHRRIVLSEAHCSQFVAGLCQICSHDFEPWQGLKGQVVTSLCQSCYRIVAKVPTNPTIPIKEKESSASGDAQLPNYVTAKAGKKVRPLTGKSMEMFLQFWEVFNLKINKAQAAAAWMDLADLEGQFEQIMIAAKIESRRRAGLRVEGLTPIQAPNFLKLERWTDEIYQKKEVAIHPQKCGTCMEFYTSACEGVPATDDACEKYRLYPNYDRSLFKAVA